MATNIQDMLMGGLLMTSIIMISAAIMLFGVKICYGEACLKRSKRVSIIMGVLGWLTYLIIMMPIL